jgi:hypothetical protein
MIPLSYVAMQDINGSFRNEYKSALMTEDGHISQLPVAYLVRNDLCGAQLITVFRPFIHSADIHVSKLAVRRVLKF